MSRATLSPYLAAYEATHHLSVIADILTDPLYDGAGGFTCTEADAIFDAIAFVDIGKANEFMRRHAEHDEASDDSDVHRLCPLNESGWCEFDPDADDNPAHVHGLDPEREPGEMICVCARHGDGSVTRSMCPLHADTDPCLTMATVTGRRRKGTILHGVCTHCGWSGGAR